MGAGYAEGEDKNDKYGLKTGDEDNMAIDVTFEEPYDISGSRGQSELKIPEGVKTVCGRGSRDLESITFPDTLTEIPANCFSFCHKLKRLYIPGSVKTIQSEAFYGCDQLENVVMGEGIEEIGEGAFKACDMLKRVVLPSTIKKIGNEAFVSTGESFGYIALPKGIAEIESESFAYNYQTIYSLGSKEIIYFVAKNSRAQKCVKTFGFKYRIRSLNRGLLLKEAVDDGTLFLEVKPTKRHKVNDGISKIAERAFGGCDTIESVVFPKSLKEIESFAFEGCSSIIELNFAPGIEKIGAKAFWDTKLKYIDLPNTVKNLAPDAFPSDCVVCVCGEMPRYDERAALLQTQKEDLEDSKMKLSRLKESLARAEKLYNSYQNNPEELNEILQLEAQADELETRIDRLDEEHEERKRQLDDLRARLDEQREELNKKIIGASQEIDLVNMQIKKCFFLAVSKKKELEQQIADKQQELKALKDAFNDKSKIDENEAAKKAEAQNYIRRRSNLYGELKNIRTTSEQLKAHETAFRESSCAALANYKELADSIAAMSREIETEKVAIEKDEECLNKEHTEWAKKREAAQRSLLKAKLKGEKKSIISDLPLPKYDCLPMFEFVPNNNAIAEEKLLNENYLIFAEKQNEINLAAACEKIIENESRHVERVKEINRTLKLEEYDGIEIYRLAGVDAENTPLAARKDYTPELHFFKNADMGKIEKTVKPSCETEQIRAGMSFD